MDTGKKLWEVDFVGIDETFNVLAPTESKGDPGGPLLRRGRGIRRARRGPPTSARVPQEPGDARRAKEAAPAAQGEALMFTVEISGTVVRRCSTWKKAKSRAKALRRRTRNATVARNHLKGIAQIYAVPEDARS